MPGLELVIDDAPVELMIGFNMQLGFGVDVDDGAFVDASGADELVIEVEATTPDLNTTGNIRFVPYDITDLEDRRTLFDVDFAIDLLPGPGRVDGRLVQEGVDALALDDLVSVDASGVAGIHLDMTAFDVPGGEFPRIKAGLEADWVLDSNQNLIDVTPGLSWEPDITFGNVQINLDDFYADQLSPTLLDINEAFNTGRWMEFLDVITSPIPGLSDVVGDVALLDLLLEAAFPGGANTTAQTLKFIVDALVQFFEAIASFPTSSDVEWLPQGSFFVDHRVADPNFVFEKGTDRIVRDPVDSNNDDGVPMPVPLKIKELNGRKKAGGGGVGKLSRVQISFPLLGDDGDAFTDDTHKPKESHFLLLGEQATLWELKLPKIQLNAIVGIVFAIPPVFSVAVTGGIEFNLNLVIGYDTFGLSRAFVSGDPDDQKDGLFFVDRSEEQNEGIGFLNQLVPGANLNRGTDLPEMTLVPHVSISASVGTKGTPDEPGSSIVGVTATFRFPVEFDLRDPNGDGKVRFSETEALEPGGVFDVTGAWDFVLSLSLALIPIPIVDLRIVEFGTATPGADVQPDLGEVDAGVLRLNMGPRAAQRNEFTVDDVAETFHVAPGDGVNTVLVSAFGFHQEFTGVSRIEADGGAFDDTITISPSLTLPVSLVGGDGNDRIVAGAGPATLDGGAGDDTLVGGALNDTLRGNVGDDSLQGGPGADLIQGGSGADHLDGDRGADTIDGDGGADTISGGRDVDVIDGGADGDRIFGDLGDDEIDGGPGDDVIDGGVGRDRIAGGGGADTARGGTGADTIFGDFESEDDVDPFTEGDDVLFGETGNDTIRGGGGADSVDGGPNNDLLFGDDGDDTVIGGQADDELFGGGGADLVYAHLDEAGSDQPAFHLIHGGAGDDTVFGDRFEDRITGGDGHDVVHGLAGDNLLLGGRGDDTLHGSETNDALFGDTTDEVLLAGENPDALRIELDRIQSDFDLGNPDKLTVTGAASRFTTMLNNPDSHEIVPKFLSGQTIDGVPGGGLDLLLGNGGTDWLFGGSEADQLFGAAADDYLDGGAGNDLVLSGGPGDDIVRGGANNDVVHGDEGIDLVYGDDDADRLFGDAGNGADQVGQRLFGGAGEDFLFAYAPEDPVDEQNQLLLPGDELFGGPGGDFLYGNIRVETLDGGEGKDIILGDWLRGPTLAVNPEADTFGADDTLLGGAGEDQLFGGGGDDELWGGADTDRLDGQAGSDRQLGGSGIDLFLLWTAADPLADDEIDGHLGNAPGNQTIDDNAFDILVINGTTGDDRILLSQQSTTNPATGQKQLRVEYNVGNGGQPIDVDWLDAGGRALVEKFLIAGLAGDDTIGFAVDTSMFPEFGTDAPMAGAEVLDLSTLTDTPGLSDRLLIGDFTAGDGDDTVLGGAWRDRLIGGRGSDEVFGFGGDDQLFGDDADGGSTDTDRLFAGAGNDDLIGGIGTNRLHAWSFAPDAAGTDFGVFVDGSGALVGANTGALVPEDTGLNRMVGMDRDDALYGGTVLDFMYGGAGDGQDTLFGSDGRPFTARDGDQAGDAWKQYAEQTGQVWYVAGTNADDRINVDFVTEPGLLADHHLITRLTDNDGNQSFAAQVRLDHQATDENGDPIWDAADVYFDVTALIDVDAAAASPSDFEAVGEIERAFVDGLLPPEGAYLAIIIDALDGDDSVVVGPTVRKSVWVDAGAGDDHVEIRSGNPILSDLAEFGTTGDGLIGRNDDFNRAFAVALPARGQVLDSLTLDNAEDEDWFALEIAAPVPAGASVSVQPASVVDEITLRLFDGPSEVDAVTALPGAIATLSLDGLGLVPATTYALQVISNLTPTIYQMTVDLRAPVDTEPLVLRSMAIRNDFVRRDVILGGDGDDVLMGGPGEDWVFGGDGADVISGGLDRQAVDVLFAGAGDDTFQLIPDFMPTIGNDSGSIFEAGSETFLQDTSDILLGEAGDDQVLFLGGDLDDSGRPVPDHVALRYNTGLHRYELASLVWDVANQRFATEPAVLQTGADPVTVQTRRFLFYQARDVERSVILTMAGDDVVRADPGFKFLPIGEQDVFDPANFATWGIAIGDGEQAGAIVDLDIRGGLGNDRLYGGAGGDTINGGPGDDVVSGGDGDDELHGGGGADLVAGQTLLDFDRFEIVTRGGGTSANNAFAFAAEVEIRSGTIDGLTLHQGDTDDWYLLRTPDAIRDYAGTHESFLSLDRGGEDDPDDAIESLNLLRVKENGDDGSGMITGLPNDLGDITASLFPAIDPNALPGQAPDPDNLVPMSEFDGVPEYYLLHIRNDAPNEPRRYRIEVSPRLGVVADVPAGAATHTVGAEDLLIDIGGAQPVAGQAVFIPLGDVNDDAFTDAVTAVFDRDPAAGSSFARIDFGTGSLADPFAEGFVLELPAPVLAELGGARARFSSPGDYDGTAGPDDIAVSISGTALSDGVYLLFGHGSAPSSLAGSLNLLSDAQASIGGLTGSIAVGNGGRLDVDALDDLLVGDDDKIYIYPGRSMPAWQRATLLSETFESPAFPDAVTVLDPDGELRPDFSFDGWLLQNGTTPAENGLWHWTSNFPAGNGPAGTVMRFGIPQPAELGGAAIPANQTFTGRAISPTINLPAGGNPLLTFDYLVETEGQTGADVARVLIDTGGQIVPLEGATNQPGGRFTDGDGTWGHIEFALSAFSGESVQILFEFDTVDRFNNDMPNGFWFLDNVNVTDGFNARDHAFRFVDEPMTRTVTGAGAILDSTAQVAYAAFDGSGELSLRTLADSAPRTTVVGFGSLNTPRLFAIANVNGDVAPDLLVTSDEASWLIFGGVADGRNQLIGDLVSAGEALALPAGSMTPIGDFNGDGITDLAAAVMESTPVVGSDTGQSHQVVQVYFGSADPVELAEMDLVLEADDPLFVTEGALAGQALRIGTVGDVGGFGVGQELAVADQPGDALRVYDGRDVTVHAPAPGSGAGTAPDLPEDFHRFDLAAPFLVTAPSTNGGADLSAPGDPSIDEAFALEGSEIDVALASLQNIGDFNGDRLDDYLAVGETAAYVLYGPVRLDGVESIGQFAEHVIDLSGLGRPSRSAADLDLDAAGTSDLQFVERKDANEFWISRITGGTGRPRHLGASDATRVARSFEGAEVDGAPVSTVEWGGAAGEEFFLGAAFESGPHIETADFAIVLDRDYVERLRVFRDTRDPVGAAESMLGRSVDPSDVTSAHHYATSVVGDVNGDGLDDIVVTNAGFVRFVGAESGLPDIGRAYLVLGGTTGDLDLDDAAATYEGFSIGGAAVRVGDLNRDGLSEITVPVLRETDRSALHVVSGSSSFAQDEPAAPQRIEEAAALSFRRDESLTLFGQTGIHGLLQATSGDFNLDGRSDLIVGDPRQVLSTSLAANIDPAPGDVTVLADDQRGAAHVFFSIGDRFETGPREILLSEASISFAGLLPTDRLGALSATPGLDLDGNGIADIALGAAGATAVAGTSLDDAGRIHVIYGSRTVESPDDSDVTSLANTAVPGSGQFVVNRATGRPVPFDDGGAPFRFDPATDTDGRWFQFTTLGDGAAGNAIRITPSSLPASDMLTPTAQGTVNQAGGVEDGRVLVGEGNTQTGVLEFDLGQYARFTDDPDALERVLLNVTASDSVPLGRISNLTPTPFEVYFTADTAGKGVELWKSDGTYDGTVLVKDIRGGPEGSNPRNLTYVDNLGVPEIYFTIVNDAGDHELWKTEGSAATTRLVSGLQDGPSDFVAGDSPTVPSLLFIQSSPATGREVWRMHLFEEIPRVFADPNGVLDSNPAQLTPIGGTAFYTLARPDEPSTLNGLGPLLYRAGNRLDQDGDATNDGDVQSSDVVVNPALLGGFDTNELLYITSDEGFQQPDQLVTTGDLLTTDFSFFETIDVDDPSNFVMVDRDLAYVIGSRSGESGQTLYRLRAQGSNDLIGEPVVSDLPGDARNLTAIGTDLFYTTGSGLWHVSATERRSEFLNTVDGWGLQGDSSFVVFPAGASIRVDYPFTGIPSGAAEIVAPAKFRGDLRDLEGGVLSFDMALSLLLPQFPVINPGLGTVTMRRGASSISLDMVPANDPPDPAFFTRYSTAMTAAAWGVSQATWDFVIADVEEMTIDVDASEFFQILVIDNVEILPPQQFVASGSNFNTLTPVGADLFFLAGQSSLRKVTADLQGTVLVGDPLAVIAETAPTDGFLSFTTDDADALWSANDTLIELSGLSSQTTLLASVLTREGDGHVEADDRTFTATALAPVSLATGVGPYQVDLTVPVREALANDRTRLTVRLINPADPGRFAIEDAGLEVTLAGNAPGALVADLIDEGGRFVQQGAAAVDLRAVEAGTYFVRVRQPDGLATSQPLDFSFEFDAPFAGASHDRLSQTDRDIVFGGDGDDIVIGNDGVDRLFGGSGGDIVIAQSVERRDVEIADILLPAAPEDEIVNSAPLPLNPVVDVPDPALRAAIGSVLHVNPADPYRAVDLATITSLDLAGADIANPGRLSGLEHFLNLRTLNLSGANLNTADLQGLVPRTLTTGPNAGDPIGLRSVHVLALDGNPSVTDVSALEALTSLQALSLDATGVVPDAAGTIDALTNLTDLVFLSLPVSSLSSAHNLVAPEGQSITVLDTSDTGHLLTPTAQPVDIMTVNSISFPVVVDVVAPGIDAAGIAAVPAQANEGQVLFIDPSTLAQDPADDVRLTVLDPDGRAAALTTGSLLFDGVDDVATARGFTGITGTQARTVTAWIRTTSTTAQAIVHWGTDIAGRRWTVRTKSFNGVGNLRLAVDSGGVDSDPTSAGVDLADGDWHHVAVAWSPSEGPTPDVANARLCIDGVRQSTRNLNPEPIDTSDATDLIIGSDSNGAHFNGWIDDLRLFDRALSDEEIAAQSASGAIEGDAANLAAYWRFDEGAGDLAGDQAPLAHDAILGDGDASRRPSWSVAHHPLLAPMDFRPENDGPHELEITVTDELGATAVGHKTITVLNADPTAVIDWLGGAADPIESSAGDALAFDATGSTDPGVRDVLRYDWQVTSDNGATVPGATGPQFDFVPLSGGRYTLELTVSDEDGGASTDQRIIDVDPVAVITTPGGAAVEGDVLNFSAADATPPAPFATRRFAWTVEYDDGQTGPVVVATGDEPDLVFMPADDGSYTVSLAISDGIEVNDVVQVPLGDDVTQFPFVVTNAAPTLLPLDDRTVDEGMIDLAVALTDAGAADSLTLTVDWDDGRPPEVLTGLASGAVALGHDYPEQGEHTLMLTVSDDDGDSTGRTLRLTVVNVDPSVDAGPDQSVDDGAMVTFAGIATDVGSDTLSITWDFGDGTKTSGTLAPTHTYERSGQYRVGLTVIDDEGGSSTDLVNVTVVNDPPAALTVDGPASPSNGVPAVFTGSFSDFTGDAVRGTIRFGDGARLPLSIQPSGPPAGDLQPYVFSAQHVYAAAALRTVEVEIVDEDGAIARQTLDVLIDDTLPPRVTEVRIGSRQWTSDFVAQLPGSAIAGRAFEIPTGGAAQLAPLPWDGLDRVQMVFSEDVEVESDALSLNGTNVDVHPIEDFAYDSASRTATWTFVNAFVTDKLRMTLADSVQDALSNGLDGEWIDGQSAISGDGQAGGAFRFRFDVSVADVDRDGSTSVLDVKPLREATGTAAGDAAYSIFADLDGNGAVDDADRQPLRMNLGRALPASEPPPGVPGSRGPASVVLTGNDRVVATPVGAPAVGSMDIRLQTPDGAPIDVLNYSVRVRLVGPEAGAAVRLTGGGEAGVAPAVLGPDPLNTHGNVDRLPIEYYLGTLDFTTEPRGIADGAGLIRVDYEIDPGAIGAYTVEIVAGRPEDTYLVADPTNSPIAFTVTDPRLTISIPGDANGDFVVGADDLSAVLSNFTATVSRGDFSRGDLTGPAGVPDGIVGTDDLVLVLSRFTDTVTPPATARSSPTGTVNPWHGWHHPPRAASAGSNEGDDGGDDGEDGILDALDLAEPVDRGWLSPDAAIV